MRGVYYGDEDIQASNVQYAIIDSGTSLLYLGSSDYQVFLAKLIDSERGDDLNCSDESYCYSDDYTCDYFTPYLESLTIILGNNHYTI